MRAGWRETNVVVPPSCAAALAALCAESGRSRAATLRDLLTEHVDAQRVLGDDSQLVHIATLLRHPPPARFALAAAERRVRLRVRCPAALAAEARRLGLRLPGQWAKPAHADYQARCLADTVMTAIARRRAFTDEVLADLLPLLRRRAAIGLWQLAVAATATGSERSVLADYRMAALSGGAIVQPDLARLETVVDLIRAGDVAWHGDRRVHAVRHLARRLLTGADAVAHEKDLFAQRDQPWGLWRDDLEHDAGALDHPLIVGLRSASASVEGRGGTLIWRAQREVAIDEVEAALLSSDPGWQMAVDPPSWTLRHPDSWAALVVGRGRGGPPPAWAVAVEDHRVLFFTVGSRRVVWPVSRGGSGYRPASNVDQVLRQYAGRRAGEVAEYLLLRLDLDRDEPVGLPAELAHRAGFISRKRREALEASALAETRQRMAQLVSHPSKTLAPTALTDLAAPAARGDVDAFLAAAAQHRVWFVVTPALWPWRIESLAAAVLARTHRDATHWLADYVASWHRTRLRDDHERAWHDAFNLHRPDGM